MSQLDERSIVRLMEVAEERDLAFVQIRVGQSELTIARVPPSELDALALSTPPRTRPVEREAPGETEGASSPRPLRTEAPSPPAAAAPVQAATPSGVEGGVTIDSPMVGAFYRAPAPDQAPFVEIGSVIEPGDTVGLVEAMKVFTAVPATHAGVVREILVDNGAFVEFGQPLLAVEVSLHGTGPGRASRG